MFHFKSLRTRITSHFLILTMVATTIFVIIISTIRSSGIHQREMDKLTITRDLHVQYINAWIRERVGDIEQLLNDDDIFPLIQNPQLTPKNIEDIRRNFQNVANHYEFYEEILYISADTGEVIVSTSLECEHKNRSFNPFFKTPLNSNQKISVNTYISDVHKNREEIAFSTPVTTTKDGEQKVHGILVMIVNLENVLHPLVKSKSQMGKTGETFIVNREALAMNKLKWDENVPLEMKIQAEYAQIATQGHSDIIKSLDYRGEKVLVAFSHIPVLDWGIIVKRDYDEIYGPIKKMWLQMILLMALLFPIILVVAMMVSRSIAKPIQEINKSVSEFQKGKFSQCVVKGHDEVATLANAFNAVAQSVYKQISTREGVLDVAKIMVNSTNVEYFAEKLILKFIDLSGCQVGAFYMLDESSSQFKHVDSVGLDKNLIKSFCSKEHEGELGKVMANKTISIVKDIPLDSMFAYKTTVGNIIPREIITIPIIVQEKIAAIISLASMNQFNEVFKQIVQQSLLPMGTILASLLSDIKSRKLTEELIISNAELQSQATELEQQTVELEEQAEELENQRARVEQANKLKSEFLSNMSHELRTPLNSVLSLSQLMLASNEEKQDQVKNKECVEIIERNGKRLLNLINDILDLSKIEAGKMDLYLSSFTVNELIDPVIASMKNIGIKKGLNLNINIENLEFISQDKEKMQQILFNVISNAIKFTNEGEVNITVSKENQSVLFEISDTGIGIPQYALKSIFDEFRQVDGSTTRQYGGTGLGLAICKKLTNMLGGEITVESEVDVGTKISLYIPIKIENEKNDQYNENPKLINNEKLISVGKKPRILVVEDDKVAREQIQRVLKEAGFKVNIAKDGEDAINILQQKKPDAMILDLMMPKIDGFEVVENIRSIPETQNLPVLILTAKDISAKEKAKLSYNNVHQLIQKGNLNREQLVEAVYKLIGLENNKENQNYKVKQNTITKIDKIELNKNEQLSILVVDDYEDNLTATVGVLKNALNDLNVVVHEARNGLQALEVAKKKQPHIICMDIQMPIMGGFEATSIIKRTPELYKTIIIALTASAMMGDKDTILNAGFDDYISKPVEYNKINETIRKWIKT